MPPSSLTAASVDAAPPAALVLVPFHGEQIQAVVHEGAPWLPLRPLCQRFGVDPKSQRVKLRGKAWATCEVIITSQMPGDDQSREMFCLSLDSLPGWLFSLNPSKVAPEAREGLVRYQREAARVLYAHFLGAGRAAAGSAAPPTFALTPGRQLPGHPGRGTVAFDRWTVEVYFSPKGEVYLPLDALASQLGVQYPAREVDRLRNTVWAKLARFTAPPDNLVVEAIHISSLAGWLCTIHWECIPTENRGIWKAWQQGLADAIYRALLAGGGARPALSALPADLRADVLAEVRREVPGLVSAALRQLAAGGVS